MGRLYVPAGVPLPEKVPSEASRGYRASATKMEGSPAVATATTVDPVLLAKANPSAVPAGAHRRLRISQTPRSVWVVPGLLSPAEAGLLVAMVDKQQGRLAHIDGEEQLQQVLADL